jgi:hypothetical protein
VRACVCVCVCARARGHVVAGAEQLRVEFADVALRILRTKVLYPESFRALITFQQKLIGHLLTSCCDRLVYRLVFWTQSIRNPSHTRTEFWGM